MSFFFAKGLACFVATVHTPLMNTTTAANDTKKQKTWGKPGDVVTGRTKDGKRWTATVAPSGKLIGKQIVG